MFDEIHFAGFIHQYIQGKYLFDIHPPLGKLTLVLIAKIFGYEPIDFAFNSIGQSFGDLMFYPQRSFAAICGSLIPPVMYLTCRSLSLSVIVSMCTAAMPLFDFLLCVESRLILTDSQLILHLQCAYLFAFLLWQTPRSTPRRYLFLVMTAIFAASALSTKWTAFVAPLLIAFISLTGLIFPYARLDILEMGIAGIIAAFIYIGSFYIHFKLLPLSGRGDAFMKREFQATLLGNKFYNAEAPKISFLKNFWYINWEMLRANSAIVTRHPWESKWYEWLYNARGILYADVKVGNGLKERVYIVVNPILSIITAVGVITSLLLIFIRFIRWVKLNRKNEDYNDNYNISNKRRRHRRRRHHVVDDGEKEDKLGKLEMENGDLNTRLVGVLAFSFVAWCANLFPYIGITRCTFIYHVLPSLQISSLMTGIMLNFLPRKYAIRPLCCLIITIAMAAAYYRWRPWIYALPRTEKELQALRLLPRWD